MRHAWEVRWVVLPALIFSLAAAGKPGFPAGRFAGSPAIENRVTRQLPEIWRSPQFRKFSRNFFINFFNYADYYHIRPVIERKEEFLKQLEASDGEESTLSLIYEDFGLSFEAAMEHRNRLDNDLLHLLIDFPELVEASDEEILQVITQGIDMGFRSGDDDWLLVEEDIRQGINGLTVGEVWDCMKKAIGFGSASILSLSALKELASKKGIQEVVKTVSVALAKKAGWIGAAVTLFEFSTCIYNEYKD